MNEQNRSIKTEMEGILYLSYQQKLVFNSYFFLDTGLVVEEPDINGTNTTAQKDEFSEILGSHFNIDSMVRETGKYVFFIILDLAQYLLIQIFIFIFILYFYIKNRISSNLIVIKMIYIFYKYGLLNKNIRLNS